MVDAAPWKFPRIRVLAPATSPECSTDLMIGKFCRPLGPASTSPMSLGVTPLPSKSMPRAELSKMEFCVIVTGAGGVPGVVTRTPRIPLVITLFFTRSGNRGSTIMP